MRHQKRGRKFGREKDQRRALIKTMLGSLIMREKITTTEAKAKELKNKIDPVINKAKKARDSQAKVSVLRNLRTAVPDMAVGKLSQKDFMEKFEKRSSGYTRVTKLPRRIGDGARMAVIEFVQ